MGMHTYIGARYVPNFLGTYDPTQEYTALDVVDNGSGTSYIARIPTPAGTPLTDTTHWKVYGAASGAIVNLQNQIDQIKEGFVTPEMYGAVGDGVTDDTAAINDALAVGGTIVFNSGSTYAIDTDVSLLPESNSTIDLNGAKLKAIPNGLDYYEVIMIQNKKNVVVKNGTIVGDRDDHTGLTGEWGHGIYVHSSDNVHIDNMSISDCWGDGIYVGDQSTNVKIENCTIDNNRRQGISIVEAQDVIVTNNLIKNTNGTAPQAGIDIEPNASQTCKHVLVSNNMFYNNPHCIMVTGGNTNAVLEDVIIDGNIILAPNSINYPFIDVVTADNVTVSNNFMKGITTKSGMVGTRIQHLKMSGNKICDSQLAYLVSLSVSHQAHISDNYFENCTLTAEGFYVSQSQRCAIDGNIFIDITGPNPGSYCIYFVGSTTTPADYNVISNNIMIDITYEHAIDFGNYASNNRAVNNVIQGTYAYTIYNRLYTGIDNRVYFNDIKSGTSGSISGIGGSFTGTALNNIIDNVLV